MILRFWLIAGILIVGLAWVLIVPLSPPAEQVSATSAIQDYREAGLLPRPGALVISSEIGHEVFEIPTTDADHAAEEAAVSGDMPGMQMGGEAHAPADGTMEEADHGAPMAPEMEHQTPPAAPADHGGHGTPDMTMGGGMAMPESPAAAPTMDIAEMAGTGMHGEEMAGEEMAGEEMHGEAAHSGGAGLRILATAQAAGRIDREIAIEMGEWGFAPANLMVAAGEVIRFTVRNAGNMPHEFMFMPPRSMAAVAYRLERADLNITEHEALFEQAIVLPGDSFEVVVKIEQPGVWMYMCMFPFHMQFGMMGMMMTEGAAMESDPGMGHMKM